MLPYNVLLKNGKRLGRQLRCRRERDLFISRHQIRGTGFQPVQTTAKMAVPQQSGMEKSPSYPNKKRPG
jgi:hypothetical protein